MNTSIFRLYALFVVLFGVLVAFSSRWAVFGATGLRENPKNSRVVIEEQRIKRGVIRAADNEVLAGSTPLSDKRYARRYPTGELFAQPVGFDSVRFGRAGLELFYNDRLTGRKEELANIVDSLVERDQVGDDLQTTLVPKAQQLAYDELGRPQGRRRRAAGQGRRGARAGRQPVLQSEPAGREEHLQSRDPGPVPARLDVQDGDGDGRDRLRRLPAGLAREWQEREGDLRHAVEQLRPARLRRDHADRGADELGEHGLGRSRRQARARDHAGVHGPLRVRGEAADGLSRSIRWRSPARAGAGR